MTLFRARRWPVTLSVGALAILVIGAVLVPMLAERDPRIIGDVLTLRLLPPFTVDRGGHLHLLGTDAFGRDVFARMMLAARLSLTVGILGSVLAGAAGALVGATAASLGGVVDRLTMGLSDALLAVPRLVLLLVCAALWAPGFGLVVIVLVATGWMGIARLVRAEVLGLRTRPFVEAAHAIGVKPPRLLWRHVLPNALAPAIAATTLGVGSAILLESGLSFLGLGIQPPAPSWGNMIADGRGLIVVAPWVALAPGLALIVTVLACTLIGDELQARTAGYEVARIAPRTRA